MNISCTLLILFLGIFFLTKVCRIIQVSGNSMHPTYKEGEYYFAYPVTFNQIKEGDVIITKTPNDSNRIVLKRVRFKSMKTKELFLLGDNLEDSFDSRNYGFIPYNPKCTCKVFCQRKKERL